MSVFLGVRGGAKNVGRYKFWGVWGGPGGTLPEGPEAKTHFLGGPGAPPWGGQIWGFSGGSKIE